MDTRRRCRLQKEEDRGYICEREVALHLSINQAGEKLFASNARRQEISDDEERSGEKDRNYLFLCVPIICEGEDSVLPEVSDINYFGFFTKIN